MDQKWVLLCEQQSWQEGPDALWGLQQRQQSHRCPLATRSCSLLGSSWLQSSSSISAPSLPSAALCALRGEGGQQGLSCQIWQTQKPRAKLLDLQHPAWHLHMKHEHSWQRAWLAFCSNIYICTCYGNKFTGLLNTFEGCPLPRSGCQISAVPGRLPSLGSSCRRCTAVFW